MPEFIRTQNFYSLSEVLFNNLNSADSCCEILISFGINTIYTFERLLTSNHSLLSCGASLPLTTGISGQERTSFWLIRDSTTDWRKLCLRTTGPFPNGTRTGLRRSTNHPSWRTPERSSESRTDTNSNRGQVLVITLNRFNHNYISTSTSLEKITKSTSENPF